MKLMIMFHRNRSRKVAGWQLFLSLFCNKINYQGTLRQHMKGHRSLCDSPETPGPSYAAKHNHLAMLVEVNLSNISAKFHQIWPYVFSCEIS